MKTIFLISSLLVITFKCFSQNKELIKQADTYAKASVNKDYSTIIKYTYAPFVKMYGGSEKMLSMLKGTMEILASKGILIESVSIGDQEKIYTAGAELHCLIPLKTISKVPNGKQILSTYLLAISADQGRNWTFLNLTGGAITNDTIQKFIPNFNQKMHIPLIEPAQFIKN
ncbi:hypothetical protein D9M68_533110 [compost metagenome]